MAGREHGFGRHVGESVDEGLAQGRILLDHRHERSRLTAIAPGQVLRGQGVDRRERPGCCRSRVVAGGADEGKASGGAASEAVEADVAAEHLLDHLVDGVGGHLAVGGQLPAGDGHEARLRAQHPVHAGQVGGAPGAGGLHQRPQARPGADHVVGGDRALDREVERAQQVLDVIRRALWIVDGTVVVGVGRADVGEAAVGHDEHRASVARHRHHHRNLVADLLPGHGDVDALGRPDRVGVGSLVLLADVVHPHARRVDHGACAYGELLVVARSAGPDHDSVDPSLGVLLQAHRRGSVGHHGAVVERGGAQDRDHEAGVVDGGVVVEVGRNEAVASQRRHVGERLVVVEALVELADAPATGEVVAPHRDAQEARDLGGDHSTLAEHRDQERQYLDQVRGVAEHPAPLAERLVDETDLALLQVAEASVGQLGGLRRGALGEIARLDQGGLHAACGGVEHHAGTRDAAADHHQVELLVAQRREGRFPVESPCAHLPSVDI